MTTRAARLADTIQRGLGRAGRALGPMCELYRPATSKLQPLDHSLLVLRLPVAFAPHGGDWKQPQPYGHALWDGLFDAAYTRPGDYIVRAQSRTGLSDGGIWFIAGQQALLPPLCVRANRIVTFTRVPVATVAGVASYGGVTTQPAVTLIAGWPACVLDAGTGGRYQADLPTDTTLGDWTVLLPSIPGQLLQEGDKMIDDLGRSGIVAAAELTELGWRMNIKQAAT